MYKTFTPEQMKIQLGLPEDYSVSGLLSYGAWDEQAYFDKLHAILNELGIKHSSKKLAGFLNRIYEIKIEGKNYWFTLLYGGAMLSEYVHFACLFDSKKNIHIGSCGGLHPEINSLDFIIPTWSFGNDSVTRLYSRDVADFKHYSDKKLSQLLKEKITLPNKIWEGPIVNCQGMMGETWEDVQSWSKDGYYGVEMETSTLFSVSNHYKVPCAGLVYVSDNLIKGQTIEDEAYNSQKTLREESKNEVFRAGLKTLIE